MWWSILWLLSHCWYAKQLLVRNKRAIDHRWTFVCIDPTELTNNVRDSYNRDDPDAILNGFLPFWGVLLFILSGIVFSPSDDISISGNLGSALVLTGFALLGYLIGCRTPPKSRQPSADSTAPFYVIQNYSMAI